MRPTFFDRGTPELQQKRHALLKEKTSQQDTALTESLLGILYAHQIIDRSLYEAGCQFEELRYRYQLCLGRAIRASSRARISLFKTETSPHMSMLTEAQEIKRKKAWHNAVKILKEEGSHPYRVVMAVVFHEYTLAEGIPGYLMREMKALRKGLARLDIYFNPILDKRMRPLHGGGVLPKLIGNKAGKDSY